jgi:hypothetical protein
LGLGGPGREHHRQREGARDGELGERAEAKPHEPPDGAKLERPN